MGIALIHDLKTIRTNPRLMKHKTSDAIIMTLHDHVKPCSVVWLNGPDMGRVCSSADLNWESFDDLRGSVTLYNND